MSNKLLELSNFLLHRRQVSFWDDFDKPSNGFSVHCTPLTTSASAGGDNSATVVFVNPSSKPIRVVGAYGTIAGSISGIAAAPDASVWALASALGTIVTKTLVADPGANTPFSLGTPTLPEIPAGGYVTLAITNGANCNCAGAVAQVALQCLDSIAAPSSGWSVVGADGGSVTISDAANGVCTIVSGGTDNDEIYLFRNLETYKFVTGATIVVEARLKYTEASTDDANIMFGLMNAVAANSLVDNGAGPKSTGDYALIWKIDGSTVWRAGVQSNGTATPTTDTDSVITAGGGVYQVLRIEVYPETSTAGYACFYVDGVQIAIIHFTYASATEMQLVLGIKAGGANAETVYVDYAGGDQLRV
jgi:hypothetical protein